MDFIEACKQLIAIDSSPGNGTGEACQFIKKISEKMGFKVLLEEEIQRGILEANIICFPNEIEKNVHLMLQTHLDTVDPGSFSLWEKTGRNPFQATIHDGKMYGLGTADTKLDFLCKLYGAKSFLGKKMKKPFVVVGTFGEEYSMQGAVRLVRHKMLNPKLALIGEPTEFNLVHAGKGLANIEVTLPFSEEEMRNRRLHDTGESQSAQCKIFRGTAAHSSQPHKGVNALEQLMSYLKQLPEQLLVLEIDGGTNYNTIPIQGVLEFDLTPMKEVTVNQKLLKIFDQVKKMEKEFEKIKDPSFDPPMATLNIGMARTYSDHLKFMGCVRWPPKVNGEVYRQWMEDLRQYCESIGTVFRVRDYKKPFENNAESDFSKLCMEAIKEQVPTSKMATQPVTNEANVFNKFSIESLVFGPGLREGNSQTTEESIEIEELHRATQIYENIIRKVCS